MNERIRLSMNAARVAAGVLASLLLASSAMGEDPAAEALEEDVVYAVRPGAMTITLGEVVHRVTDKSRLFDAAGRRISLSEIDPGSMVEYTSRPGERDGPPHLGRLQVRDGDYE